MSADYWDEWVCTFPGKMGLSWKLAHPYSSYKSKAEADAQAEKNANVVAIPRQLFDKMKEHERRMVIAETFHRSCQVKGPLVAHLNIAGRVVSCSVTWTKPSEAVEALRTALKFGTLDEFRARILLADPNFQFGYTYEKLLELTPYQLAALDERFPRTTDLTDAKINWARGQVPPNSPGE